MIWRKFSRFPQNVYNNKQATTIERNDNGDDEEISIKSSSSKNGNFYAYKIFIPRPKIIPENYNLIFILKTTMNPTMMMVMLVEKESWSNYFLGESLIIINFPANRQSVGVSQKVKTLGRRLFVAISVSKFF